MTQSSLQLEKHLRMTTMRINRFPKRMIIALLVCLFRDGFISHAFNCESRSTCSGLVSIQNQNLSRCRITELLSTSSDPASDAKLSSRKRLGFGAWVKSRRLPFQGRGRSRSQHAESTSVVAGKSRTEQHSPTQLSSSIVESSVAEPEFNGSLQNEMLMTILDEWYVKRAKEFVGSSTLPLEILDLFVWHFKRVSLSTTQHVSNNILALKNVIDAELIPAVHSLARSNSKSTPADLMETHIDLNAARPVIISLEDDSFIDLEDSNLRTTVENNVYKRLNRWSTHMLNVTVRARLHDRFLSKVIFRGEVCSDIRVEFDRLAFPNLKISAGGRIDVNGCALKLLSIAPHIGNIYPGKRFIQPFEFYAKDCILTQDDILESSCIQNGLQNLLNRILSSRVVRYAYSSAKVETVRIIDSQISCKGFAHTKNGVRLPFEVRSGLGISENGHILTFPGLSVALDPFLKAFMPVVPSIDLDIGANAKIEELDIIEKRNLVRISARAVVSPKRAMMLLMYRTKLASRARFQVDLGDFVTTLGKFHE